MGSNSLHCQVIGKTFRCLIFTFEPRIVKAWFKIYFLPAAVRIALIPVFCFSTSISSQAQNCSVNAGVSASFCPYMQIPLIGGTSGSFVPGSFYWIQIRGPSVIIDDPTMLMSTVTGYMGGNSYKFHAYLTCEDGFLAFQDVTYTVLFNTPAMA